VQRRISVDAIKAVTKSTKPDNTQFIVHVKSEYDYQFESDFRKEIFDAFKWVYFMKNHQNLPVYGVPDKLKDYATSKKDITNGMEVNPKEEYRLHKEDIYKASEKSTNYSANASFSSGSGASSYRTEIDDFSDEVKNSVA
jgi:hypothetical protein